MPVTISSMTANVALTALTERSPALVSYLLERDDTSIGEMLKAVLDSIDGILLAKTALNNTTFKERADIMAQYIEEELARVTEGRAWLLQEDDTLLSPIESDRWDEICAFTLAELGEG